MKVTLGLEAIEHLAGTKQCGTAARHDALFDGCAGCVERVFDALLLLLHVRFGHGTGAQDRDTAGQLGEALLQLLAVVVRRGLLDLVADAVRAILDRGLLAAAADDRGCILADADLLGAAEMRQFDLLKLDAELFGDVLTTGQGREVLQHRLATIAEARSLDGADVQYALEAVDDQRGHCFGLNVFGDDDQRLAGARDCFEQRDHLTNVRDLLLVDEHEGVVERGLHGLRVGDEVRRDVALVELHAVDVLEFGLEALAFFDRDDAFGADLHHRFGKHVADLGVVVGRDRADLGDLFAALDVDLLGHHGQFLAHRIDCEVDAVAQVVRVDTGRQVALADRQDGFGEHGRGGGAVTGNIVGLARDFANELGAHVLEGILELDFLGDGDAVLGDLRAAERLLDDDVLAGRTERDLDGTRELLDASDGLPARDVVIHDLLTHDLVLHLGEDFALAQNLEVVAADLDVAAGVLAEQHDVALLDVELLTLAVLRELAFTDSGDLAALRLLLGAIGQQDAATCLLFCVENLEYDAIV